MGKSANHIKLDLAQHTSSDHKMLINLYDSWKNAPNQKNFEAEKCINHQKMKMIHGIRGLLLRHLKMEKYIDDDTDYNRNSLVWEIVKGCITAALYRKF